MEKWLMNLKDFMGERLKNWLVGIRKVDGKI